MKFSAASLCSWFADISSATNGLKTGLGNIHRKRDARPLSTLLLSTMSGAAVVSCVMPHSVRHVRGMYVAC